MNRIATIVKGYPRLSETFIAQEILGLEKRGIAQLIVSLRHPTEGKVHDLNREIAAEVLYLPEYLKDDPARVRAGARMGGGAAGLSRALEGVSRRLKRDPLGQPPPALRPGLRAGARAARRRRLAPHAYPPHAGLGRPLRRADPRHGLVVLRARQGHLDDAGMGAARKARRGRLGRHLHARQSRLSALARAAAGENPSRLSRARFFALSARRRSAAREGDGTFTIVSVGRAVEKKGYADLLQALALLRDDRDWRFEHAGGGPLAAAAEGAGGDGSASPTGSSGTARRTAPSSSTC